MRRTLPSRTAVLDLLGSEDRPIHANEVADRLGVKPESYQGLLRLLDDLVFDGVLVARGQRFKLDQKRAGAARARERREGRLTVHPRGFGFVASPAATGDDVFVNPDALGGAMHGDHVVVEIIARGARGAEGHIVEVKKRGTTRVSGILRRRGKSAWVELDDPRVQGPLVLRTEMDTRGPEGNSGIDGQVVVAEITRFPEEPGENPEGRIIALLGRPGELSVEVKKVLFLEGIEEVHSEEAVAEAQSYGDEVPKELLRGREDLTHVPLPTIDPEDARDHDDAVWVEPTARGGYEIWVAIADVSTYVRPGTKLDEEAEKRGVSIYLPDRAIPMLPRALSSNLCSLLPGELRLCLAVHAVVDAKGAVVRSRLVRGYMKSAAKLTYGGVARALGLSAHPPREPMAEELRDGLRAAYDCARTLRTRRMRRGALDFDLPEPVVRLDEEGNPTAVEKRSTDEGVKKAYQLIEELMIFANEVVARWLIEREVPGIFRVHLPPDSKKLERLAAMCELLGIELDLDETQTPKGLQRVLASFAKHPNAQVLNSLLLRSMKQANYDIENLGHFGLASQAYLHFTSPIRRYPDLVDHRILHAALAGDERARKRQLGRAADPETLEAAAIASSSNERRAMEVEREVLDVYRCFYMIDHIGERYEGTISAFVGSGAFITLDEPFVDVLVRTEDLGGTFEIDEDGLMATNARTGEALRLGERVLVEILDVAILRRQIQARRVRGVTDELAERPPRRGRGQDPRERKDERTKPERGRKGAPAKAAPSGRRARDEDGPTARGRSKPSTKATTMRATTKGKKSPVRKSKAPGKPKGPSKRR